MELATGREEAAYIRTALLHPEALDLYPVDEALFVSQTHRKALKALRTLHAEKRGTYSELDAIMGKGYCDTLPDVMSMALSPGYLVEVIRDRSRRLKLVAVLQELHADLSNPALSTAERLSEAIGKLLEAKEEEDQVNTFRDVLRAGFKRIEQAYESRGVLGIPTGWLKLDEIIGGWEPEKLYFVSARPGAGKTSFGLQTTVEAARTGTRVYVSSQEMGRNQVAMRLISQEARVSSECMRTGRIHDADWGKLTGAVGRLLNLPGWIDTRTGMSFDQLRASVLRCHTREPVGLVLVDYVQMMRGTGESKVYELENIAYGLKNLAKELQAPVVALSQLSRGAAEGDEKQPPKLEHLRGSGGLEQAADVVIMLWQPKKDQQPNTVEVRVAKHRDGRIGRFPAQFNRAFTLFE